MIIGHIHNILCDIMYICIIHITKHLNKGAYKSMNIIESGIEELECDITQIASGKANNNVWTSKHIQFIENYTFAKKWNGKVLFFSDEKLAEWGANTKATQWSPNGVRWLKNAYKNAYEELCITSNVIYDELFIIKRHTKPNKQKGIVIACTDINAYRNICIEAGIDKLYIDEKQQTLTGEPPKAKGGKK